MDRISLTAPRSESCDVAALERVEGWTRVRFGLAETDLVLVREERAAEGVAAGNVTTVMFWDDTGERYRLKFFMPVADVRETDLPESWLRGALKDEGDNDCC